MRTVQSGTSPIAIISFTTVTNVKALIIESLDSNDSLMSHKAVGQPF